MGLRAYRFFLLPWVLSLSLVAQARTFILKADLEGLERDMRVEVFPDVALRVATDLRPEWDVTLEPSDTGNYPTVIAKSPANYVPMTELHFMHLTDVKWADLQADGGVITLLKTFAKLYKSDPSGINEQSAEPMILRHFFGSSVSLKGAMQGVADLKLFVGDAAVPDSAIPPPGSNKHPGYGVVVMIAVTQRDKLAAAESLIRRSWDSTFYSLYQSAPE